MPYAPLADACNRLPHSTGLVKLKKCKCPNQWYSGPSDPISPNRSSATNPLSLTMLPRVLEQLPRTSWTACPASSRGSYGSQTKYVRGWARDVDSMGLTLWLCRTWLRGLGLGGHTNPEGIDPARYLPLRSF